MRSSLCKKIFMFAQLLKNISTILQMCKNVSCTNLTNVQNVRKCVVHKMRKSAAQIFFQMQLLQIRKSALCTKTQMQISAHVTISFCIVKYFLHKKLI